MNDSTYLNGQQAAMLMQNGNGLPLSEGGFVEYGMNGTLAHESAELMSGTMGRPEGLVVVRFMKHCCLHYAVCSPDALARVTGRTAAAAARGVR